MPALHVKSVGEPELLGPLGGRRWVFSSRIPSCLLPRHVEDARAPELGAENWLPLPSTSSLLPSTPTEKIMRYSPAKLIFLTLPFFFNYMTCVRLMQFL